MRIDERIEQHYPGLGPQEQLAADTILNHLGDLAVYNAAELARLSGVSKATVSRLFRRLGFADFNEVKEHTRALRSSGVPLATRESDGGLPTHAALEQRNLQRLFESIDETRLGEERLVAFDMPGTTRDAITVPFERDGQRFELIDTAGLRRKGQVFEAIEKFSVIKTLQAIADANVVVLLLDATQGVTDQDAHIAGYILDSGRAVVIAINKWDAVDSYQRQMLDRSIESRLAFLKFAPLINISALKRQGLGPLWKSIEDAHASANRKMPTPVLTRLLMEAVEHQQPRRDGMYRPKMRYAHQGGMNPPIIVVHGTSLDHVTDAYKRFLEGRFRDHFKLVGTPLKIEMRSGRNPFTDKEA